MAILAPEGEVRVARPDEITGPFNLVTGLPGGGGDRITASFRVEVQSYAVNDYNGCRDLAKRSEQRILAAVGQEFAGVCVDEARIESHPSFASYANTPDIKRFIAVYRLAFRR